jgi:hypothetical protein
VLQSGWNSKVNVPLASQKISNVPAYLAPLIKFAEDTITQNNGKPSQTPIYLGATAGMRVLPASSRNAYASPNRLSIASDRCVCLPAS